MKYLPLVLIAACAVNLVSCKKKNKDDAGTPVVDSQAYMISNIQDITFTNNESMIWDLPVEWKTGKQEKVTVTIGGLPANVTVTPDTIAGLPTFKPEFTLTARHATPGTYPINVYASSATLGTKKYDVNLRVLTSANCVSEFIGSYPSTTHTYGDTTDGIYNASIVSGGPFILSITCSSLSYNSIKANLNCDNGTFVIPQQSSNGGVFGSQIKGTGQMLDNEKVVIKYSYLYGSSTTWRNYTDTLQ